MSDQIMSVPAPHFSLIKGGIERKVEAENYVPGVVVAVVNDEAAKIVLYRVGINYYKKTIYKKFGQAIEGLRALEDFGGQYWSDEKEIHRLHLFASDYAISFIP